MVLESSHSLVRLKQYPVSKFKTKAKVWCQITLLSTGITRSIHLSNASRQTESPYSACGTRYTHYFSLTTP